MLQVPVAATVRGNPAPVADRDELDALPRRWVGEAMRGSRVARRGSRPGSAGPSGYRRS